MEGDRLGVLITFVLLICSLSIFKVNLGTFYEGSTGSYIGYGQIYAYYMYSMDDWRTILCSRLSIY